MEDNPAYGDVNIYDIVKEPKINLEYSVMLYSGCCIEVTVTHLRSINIIKVNIKAATKAC